MAQNCHTKAIELIEQEQQQTPEPYLDLAYLLLFSNQKETAARALEYLHKAIAKGFSAIWQPLTWPAGPR